jgi:hypothetical protein
MRPLIDTTVLDVVIVIDLLIVAITLTRTTDTLSSLVALDHMRVSPVCLVVTELTLLTHGIRHTPYLYRYTDTRKRTHCDYILYRLLY